LPPPEIDPGYSVFQGEVQSLHRLQRLREGEEQEMKKEIKRRKNFEEK
jgi:hypothetical protein